VLGELPPETIFRWIERNSKAVHPGDLFIAVRGERLDGHQFIEDAAEHGAVAALVRSDRVASLPRAPIPLILVDEPVAALQRLAAARRARLGVTVVGITGSIGKTSTKEVVAGVLAQKFTTYRNPGNMNSEIGLPLSILEVEPGTEVAVLEMGGAYAFGELALLAEIAKPKVGVVTNVHPVHLERMGTIEAIAQTKSELVQAVPPDGVAVLNGDDHRVRAMAPLSAGPVLTFGVGFDNDLWADAIETQGLDGTSFTAHVDGVAYPVQTSLRGRHAVDLALAAIGVGLAMGMSMDEILPGFAQPDMQVRLLILDGPRCSRLIDDTYNASAPSVISALGVLAETPAQRRIAVLGDMRELGAASLEQHVAVGRQAALVVDHLVTFGELARVIGESYREAWAAIDAPNGNVTSFGLDERAELVAFLLDLLQDGDIVLLKGSRGLTMENIVAALAVPGSGA
jgi:UDP-N-acetylmuramoyl-tripeptide--D-alanyl-D-alanine ligase